MREKQTQCDFESYTVSELCEAFGVSRSGYYAGMQRGPGKREKENQILVSEIKEIHPHRRTRCYGSPRMTRELLEAGLPCSENRVAKSRMSMGSTRARRRPFVRRPRSGMRTSYQCLIVSVRQKIPQHPFSDITYVATGEGWLYLAVVMDLYSRQIAGWALDEHLETSLVTRALDEAVSSSPPGT